MDEQKSDGEKVDEIVLPGFRFHPTDEELVGFYLKRKIQQRPLSIELIRQLDIYKHDPWDLPKMAATGEKEWYFYCPRDRKYRNSTRPNRVTKAGFWKATGTDRPVYSSEGSKCIGLKKSLVFYKGRAAKGTKTDWMMHEFRLPSSFDTFPPKRSLDKTLPTSTESWAICRIFRKTTSVTHRTTSRSWISPSLTQPNHILNSNARTTTTQNNTFVSMKMEPMQMNSNVEYYSSTIDNDFALFDFSQYYDQKLSNQEPPVIDQQLGMMLPPLMDASLPLDCKDYSFNNGDISCVLGDYLGNNNSNSNDEIYMNLEGLHEEFIIENGDVFSNGSFQEELQGGILSEFDRRDELWDIVKSSRLVPDVRF